MRRLPVVLALAAVMGGAASMVLMAFGTRSALSLPAFAIATVITFGALSSARRFARQSRVRL